MDRPKHLEKWYTGKNDGISKSHVFNTEAEANDWIEKMHRADPEGVERGGYYIDGPPDDWEDD